VQIEHGIWNAGSFPEQALVDVFDNQSAPSLAYVWRIRTCTDGISSIDIQFVSGCIGGLVRSVRLIFPFQTLFRSSVNVIIWAVQKLISQTIWSYSLSLYKLERKSQHCDLLGKGKSYCQDNTSMRFKHRAGV